MKYAYCRYCHSIIKGRWSWQACACGKTCIRLLKDGKSIQLFGSGKILTPDIDISEARGSVSFTVISEPNPKIQRVKVYPFD